MPLNEDGTLDNNIALSHDSLFESTLADIELLKEAGNNFDLDKILRGDQTPVFLDRLWLILV